MSVTWRLAVAATFAAVAVVVAPQAVAVAPEMSGHYTATITPDTTASGPQPQNFDWYVTPCGDTCLNIAVGAASNPPAQAQLINGLWTLDTTNNWNCSDGTTVPNAVDNYYSWDPNTLEGTMQGSFIVAACGSITPNTLLTYKFQLKQAA
jgi:hypothetical protein